MFSRPGDCDAGVCGDFTFDDQEAALELDQSVNDGEAGAVSAWPMVTIQKRLLFRQTSRDYNHKAM